MLVSFYFFVSLLLFFFLLCVKPNVSSILFLLCNFILSICSIHDRFLTNSLENWILSTNWMHPLNRTFFYLLNSLFLLWLQINCVLGVTNESLQKSTWNFMTISLWRNKFSKPSWKCHKHSNVSYHKVLRQWKFTWSFSSLFESKLCKWIENGRIFP